MVKDIRGQALVEDIRRVAAGKRLLPAPDAEWLGAMATEQAHGKLWIDGRTCALGAAYAARGLFTDDHTVSTVAVSEAFPLLDVVVACPCGCAAGWRSAVGDHITSLNDVCGWTREQIADWVERIEQQHEAHGRP